jgi:HK97 family phage portal protein
MVWPFRSAKTLAAKFTVKNSSMFIGMGTARWLSRSYNILAAEGFGNNPVVYSCVTKLAKAISSVDLQLYRKGSDGKLKRVDKHDILDLLNNPNPVWAGRKFIEKMATQYLIGGNAYVWGNGADTTGRTKKPPKELWLLPPAMVEVKPSRTFLPEYFKYTPPGAEPIRYPVNPLTGLSEVLHLRTVNPLNEWEGLPPLAAAAYGVDIFNAGQAWNKALLQNEGRPSGALQMRQSKDGVAPILTDDQFARLREEVDNLYTGATNAGRPLLLDSALEWVQMSMSSKDMDHRETMLTTARFIAACYNTPPQLVNIPGESTYSNYGQAMLAYWSDTALPLLGSFLDDLNRWLPPLFGEPNLQIWYDEEQITALEPRRKEKSKRINDSEFMSINEKREAMGMQRYVEGKNNADDIMVSANDIPLRLVGEVDPKIHPDLAGDTPAPAEPAAKEPASK